MARRIVATVKTIGLQSLIDLTVRKEDFARDPIRRSPGIEETIRHGVREQLAEGGIPSWKPSRAFGSAQPASPTLGGPSGTVGQAWEQAQFVPGPRSAALSIDDAVAIAHHRGATIKAKRRIADGRLAMQVLLAIKGAPWPEGEGPPSEATLLAGLKLPARPMRMTERMKRSMILDVLDGYQQA